MSVRHELLTQHLPLHDLQAATLAPTEDMLPKVLVQSADGAVALFAVPQIGHADAALLEALIGAMREFGAVACLFSHYAWTLDSTDVADALVSGVRPRAHPRRREICHAIAVDREGVTLAQAPVVRSSSRQMLSAWEQHDLAEDAGEEVQSAVVEALRAGVAP